MPKIALTAEDRKQNIIERRRLSLRGLIEHKMIEHSISKSTLARALGVAERTLWYRLQSPAERLNVDDFAILVAILRITNDEIIEIVRKGVG